MLPPPPPPPPPSPAIKSRTITKFTNDSSVCTVVMPFVSFTMLPHELVKSVNCTFITLKATERYTKWLRNKITLEHV